jgi:hypothetical protein
MYRIFTFTAFVLIYSLAPTSAVADPPSLVQMIAQWQFPGSTMNGAEMADGATIGADGNRTTPSLVCKTVMTTDAGVDDVLEHYKTKLTPKQLEGDDAADTPKGGRSVVFSDDSVGRQFVMHTILVNTADSSTTLVITRGKDELKTYIGWKHYRRFTH